MLSREKTIAYSIAGAVGLWVVWSLLSSFVFGPIDELEATIANRETTKGQREVAAAGVMRDKTELASARPTSLPPERTEAQRLYLKWLDEIAASSGLTKFVPTVLQSKDIDKFATSPIQFKAEGTYEQAMLFLRRFSEVNLLHRIESFDVQAQEPPGNPRMQITATVEGLSMPAAPPRATLFTQTQLASEISAEQKEINVVNAAAFPTQAPFRIRVGSEWMNVVSIDNTRWTVERGAAQSTASKHAAEDDVEFTPLRPTPQDQPGIEEAYQKLVAANIFAKPRPPVEYRPRLSPSSTQLVTRGTPFSVTMKTESWDPAYGTAKFEFEGDIPEGLTIDAASGAMKWSPPDSILPGEYKVRVVAVGSNEGKRVPTELTLKLRNANRPPVFNPVDNPTAFLGRQLSLDVAASDPDETDRLTYSLTGQALAGATIDARTGRFTWTPAEDLEPGTVRVEVTATDNGDPPKNAKKTLSITTAEDAAQFTRLTTIFSVNGDRHARFFDQSVGKTTALRLNDDFKFADIQGKVVELEADRIVVETGGKRMQLELGMAVRDMKPAPPPAASANPPGPASKVPPNPPVAAPGEESTPNGSSVSTPVEESPLRSTSSQVDSTRR